MKIKEEQIDEIRQAVDIVEFIGQNVQLKKRGRNYIGLCPFHKEKTPSFSVNSEKGLFYCFGCKKGGDVFTFAMETQKLNYVEAIEFLAEKVGIKIEDDRKNFEQNNELENLYKINQTIVKIYNRNLLQSSEGKFALEYLNNRGINNKSILDFDIGFAKKDWDNLFKETVDVEGINQKDLLKLGLIKKRDDETFYDTFRGRIIFPISNQNGKIVGFGARKIFEDDPLGKYINSPETIVYKKSRILYGLNFAKEAIREKENVIVVEGYLDLISLFQNEIKNVVATSGTAFTIEQAKLISRFTKNIIFIYDSDFAGSNAMVRGIDIILSEGLDVKIALLPEGEDPDSFIRKFGREKFLEIINNSINVVEFKAQQLFSLGEFETIEGKTKSIRTIVETISKIPDKLKRALFIKEIAEKFGLYESTLIDELEKILNKRVSQFVDFEVSKSEVKMLSEKEKIENKNIPIEERELLVAMFKEPDELIPFIFQNVGLDEIINPMVKKIIENVEVLFNEEKKMDERLLREKLDDEETKKLLSEVTFSKYELSSRWDEVGARISDTRWFEAALGAIKKIKKRFIEGELKQNKQELNFAVSKNLDATIFLEKQHQLQNQLREIENIKLVRENPTEE